MPILLIEDIVEPFPVYRRTPLSVKEPELATEWDFERNRPWGPEDFSYGSNANVWWQCPKDKQRHRWRATISNRTSFAVEAKPRQTAILPLASLR